MTNFELTSISALSDARLLSNAVRTQGSTQIESLGPTQEPPEILLEAATGFST
jgi:hypothetical protein